MILSSNKRLIYFDSTGKEASHWPHHGTAHFVKPTPCSLIAIQAKNAFEAQCTSTEFLTCYILDRLKPHFKRLSCALKYCARDNGYFMLASGTSKKARLHPPILGAFADWADKTIWPSEPLNIIKTLFLCCKPIIEFLNRRGIIYSANWMWGM